MYGLSNLPSSVASLKELTGVDMTLLYTADTVVRNCHLGLWYLVLFGCSLIDLSLCFLPFLKSTNNMLAPFPFDVRFQKV